MTSGDFAGATLAQCTSIAPEAPSCVFSITFKPTATGTRTGASLLRIMGREAANGDFDRDGHAWYGDGYGDAEQFDVWIASVDDDERAAECDGDEYQHGSGEFQRVYDQRHECRGLWRAAAESTAMCSATGTLAAGASCTMNVLFTPQANGTRTATLNIADNATGSPQIVGLSGTGVTSSVIITVRPEGSTTATTVSGGTAYYGLLIAGAPGVTGTVQLDACRIRG